MNFVDDFSCREELHADLRDHVRKGPIGKMLHHPLIINVMLPAGYHKADNHAYRHRKQEVERFWREKNWRGYITLHERPYRAEALERVLFDGELALDHQATWHLIKSVWIDSENVEEHDEFWKDIWPEAKLDVTLNTKELAAFHNLPNMVPVWHGLERDDSKALGFSWTTHKGVAEWFAQRFARLNRRPAYIAAGYVSKQHVKAYLLSRGEHEIIVFPDNVEQVRVEPCTAKGIHPSESSEES
ncbi:hypothetical protein [Rhizobium laguerreae]|uniref:hypothetical protein n=1 Tax=Rhizobium laguerreae TaxID=1076926 RepID=UPI001C8FDF6A|nr:hypothetical protein [Rhizobium laguerreae]MBY3136505.1 hypothetical protein [Rhizobium laguerreae]